jgi:PQQ-dependent catabolism-associated CXXCW motif protein
MYRYVAIVLSSLVAAGCTTVSPPEDKDWGISPTRELRNDNFHAPTPTTIPDGTVITTNQLNEMLLSHDKPILVDVLDGRAVANIPGSLWMSGAGLGGFDDLRQERLRKHLENLAFGSKQKKMVFYCLNAQCWLSYNAALRAIKLGYANVYWYRGGIDAWKAARLPVVSSREDWW